MGLLRSTAIEARIVAERLGVAADNVERLSQAAGSVPKLDTGALAPGTILDAGGNPLALPAGTTWDGSGAGVRTNLTPGGGIVTSTLSPASAGAYMRQSVTGGSGGGVNPRPRPVDSLGNVAGSTGVQRVGNLGNTIGTGKAVVTTAPRTERLLERTVNLLERQARGRNDNGASLRRTGELP